jgi:hypothetical protein
MAYSLARSIFPYEVLNFVIIQNRVSVKIHFHPPSHCAKDKRYEKMFFYPPLSISDHTMG